MSDIFSLYYFAFHKEGICFTPKEEKVSYNAWMGASLTVEENVYCDIEKERDQGVTDEYMWYANRAFRTDYSSLCSIVPMSNYTFLKKDRVLWYGKRMKISILLVCDFLGKNLHHNLQVVYLKCN